MQGLFKAVCLSLLVGTASFSAQAVLIIQDIFIEIDRADAGNDFGISVGDSGLFGTVQYESDLAVGGLVSSDVDSDFAFEFNFFGINLTEQDDELLGSGFGPGADLLNFADPLSGVSGLYANFSGLTPVAFGQVFVDIAYFEDAQQRVIEGFLTFGAPQSTDVSEPSLLVLMLAGMFIAMRRRLR